MKIGKIENFEHVIEIFGGRFAVFFLYFSLTSPGASLFLATGGFPISVKYQLNSIVPEEENVHVFIRTMFGSIF